MSQAAINMTDRKNDHDSFLRLSAEMNLALVKAFNLKGFYSELSVSFKGGGVGVYG